jgi:DNA-binding YbaB/EbfC family protein
MGTGFSKRKKQAKMMQEQMMSMQEQMKNVEVTGSAGNGLVTVILDGESNLKSIRIKPECVDAEDIEGLEDLIKAAFNDASKQQQNQEMPQMPGMPDLKSFGL